MFIADIKSLTHFILFMEKHQSNNKITIINQDSGYLMIDIANTFVEAGYLVSLITGRLVIRNTMLHSSVRQHRIVKYHRRSIPSRLFSWLFGFIQILFLIWFRHPNDHLFIVSNPPISPLLPLFCRNSFSLLIYDVYIKKPVDFLPLKQKSPIAKLWKYLHIMTFKKAARIFTLTEGMKNTLDKYCSQKLVEVVPIWTDNDFLKPLEKSLNPFVVKHGLDKKFIVLYSGNLGATSGVEHLMEAAALVKNTGIQFVIIGEGIKKETIRKRIQELNLPNCLLLPWQETSELPYSLALADLAVVSLVSKSAKNAIPSKLFNYMSVGAPILCIADHYSDLASLVRIEDIGQSFEPGKNQQIADFILELYNNPDKLEHFRSKSLIVSKKFTKDNAKMFLSCSSISC